MAKPKLPDWLPAKHHAHALRKLEPAKIERGDGRRKYHNVPTTVDGIRFDSKREAQYYQRLCLEREAGVIEYFLRQVPLHLPGGTKLVVDFVVFARDERGCLSVRYVDAKGRQTDLFRVKRREVEHHYPITVELV